MAHFPKAILKHLSSQQHRPQQLIAYLIRQGRTGKDGIYLTKGGEAQAQAAADTIAADSKATVIIVSWFDNENRDVRERMIQDTVAKQLGQRAYRGSSDLYDTLARYFYPERPTIERDHRNRITELKRSCGQAGTEPLQMALVFSSSEQLDDLVAAHPHIANSGENILPPKPKRLPVHKLVITYNQQTGEVTDRHFA